MEETCQEFVACEIDNSPKDNSSNSKQLPVTYSCNQCEYKAKQKQQLKVHIESNHGNVTYSCDQCV